MAKWTIDRIIGIGGMAQVFAGTHRNGRPVAIKILRPELALEATLVRRFLREGYVANRVGHAGTVAILDDDIAEDGAPFLVMELLIGETLREQFGAKGLPPSRKDCASRTIFSRWWRPRTTRASSIVI